MSASPIQGIRQRAELIKSMAPCPTCLDNAQRGRGFGYDDHITRAEEMQPERYRELLKVTRQVNKVAFDCPDCGFPTHCSHEHYVDDKAAHAEYCPRLRESNEDDHDMRSGRYFKEFVLPGELVSHIGPIMHC